MTPDETDRMTTGTATLRHVFELTVLNDVGALCAAAETTDDIFAHTTHLISTSLFPDNCGFLLFDRERSVLTSHASFVLTNPNVDCQVVPVSVGICGKTARTGKPWRIDDVRTDPDYLDTDSRTRSELCLPLRFNGAVRGVMNIESSRPGAFTEADERLMIAVLDIVGAALERLQQVEELKAGEARYRQMLQSLPVGVLVQDNDRIHYANPMAMCLLGAESVEQLYATCPRELVVSTETLSLSSRIQVLLETGRAFSTIETQIRRIDAGVLDVEVSAIWTEYAGHGCAQVHFTDITERKRAEAALRESQ